jgi:nitrilase
MPEARVALYKQGLDIYLAPTADARDSWTASMRHIACESRSFVLSANQYFTKDDYPAALQPRVNPDLPSTLCRGGSLIVSPYGEVIAGPLYDTVGVLMASIDLNILIESRLDFDPAGHYSRPDLFHLTINTSEQR